MRLAKLVQRPVYGGSGGKNSFGVRFTEDAAAKTFSASGFFFCGFGNQILDRFPRFIGLVSHK
jgi:hypothetical protein